MWSRGDRRSGDEARATRRAELDSELDALRSLQREVGTLLTDLLPVPA